MEVRLVAVLALAIAVVGCGSSAGQSPSPTPRPTVAATPVPTPEPTPTPVPLPVVPLTIQQTWTAVDSASIVISGRTKPGAGVQAQGPSTPNLEAQANHSGAFTFHIGGLTLGDNGLTIIATLAGYQEGSSAITVTRVIDARGYRAHPQSMSYPVLVRDPASLAGTVVWYEGQVFQYDTNTTTSHMIVAVSNQGYGFWSDNVWLDLDPSLAANIFQKDLVGFWGTVVGPYTYTTTQNGMLTIPEINVSSIILIQRG